MCQPQNLYPVGPNFSHLNVKANEEATANRTGGAVCLDAFLQSCPSSLPCQLYDTSSSSAGLTVQGVDYVSREAGNAFQSWIPGLPSLPYWFLTSRPSTCSVVSSFFHSFPDSFSPFFLLFLSFLRVIASISAWCHLRLFCSSSF